MHVTYHDHQDTSFRQSLGDAAYAVFEEDVWKVSAASDVGHDGWDNRITVDSNDTPHMSAIDPVEFGGSGVEYYGLDASGTWQVEAVGSGPLSYKFATSVAIDPQGNPHITYHDQANGDLKLASRTSSGWEITTIDAAGETGLFPEMVIGQDGRFHVSYFSREGGSSGAVKYATRESGGATWEITEVGDLSD